MAVTLERWCWVIVVGRAVNIMLDFFYSDTVYVIVGIMRGVGFYRYRSCCRENATSRVGIWMKGGRFKASLSTT